MKYYYLGIICLVIAMIFGLFCQVSVTVPLASSGTVRGLAPNVTNAGASMGFAIAGGLCILASVFDKRK